MFLLIMIPKKNLKILLVLDENRQITKSTWIFFLSMNTMYKLQYEILVLRINGQKGH